MKTAATVIYGSKRINKFYIGEQPEQKKENLNTKTYLFNSIIEKDIFCLELIQLLADGKLHQSDFNLNKDLKNVYEIIKAYKNERDYSLEFERNGDISLYQINGNSNRTILGSFSIKSFRELAELLLKGINKGEGKTFRIIETESFLQEKLSIARLSAEASHKADIKLRIYDHRLAKETDLGFSIKSLLGQQSTLFNTGAGNNFIYEVTNRGNILSISDFNQSTYKPPKGSKIAYRLAKLDELGCPVVYKNIQSKQLWRNLKMVDGDLPQILGYALYYRWLYNKSDDLKTVTDLLETNDPLNFYEGAESNQKLYENKIKRFLTEAAMGMTSEKAWLGEYDSFGGVIVVKKDGDIVCFHIYDFNLFRNYLIENTKFEQPSTGEDKENPGNKRIGAKPYYYGWLYEEEDGKLYFKINLQVRFK